MLLCTFPLLEFIKIAVVKYNATVHPKEQHYLLYLTLQCYEHLKIIDGLHEGY